MLSMIEKSTTGFKFNPIFKKVHGKRLQEDLIVDYLNDGQLILQEVYQDINEAQIERLRLQLLELSIINIGIKKNWTESKKMSKTSKVLGTVNMFKIEILSEHEDGSKDIRVEFLKNGSYFSESNFKFISESDLEKIRSFLSDNTAYNLTVDKQCNAVTWLDLLAVINGFVEIK